MEFAFSAVYAEQCPSVNEVKQGPLKDWKAYDSDDDLPVTGIRLSHFRNDITRFALAEWKEDKKIGGSVHCYYRNEAGMGLEIYLAKHHLRPLAHSKSWYQVSGAQQCAAGMQECIFQPLLKSPQLAEK